MYRYETILIFITFKLFISARATCSSTVQCPDLDNTYLDTAQKCAGGICQNDETDQNLCCTRNDLNAYRILHLMISHVWLKKRRKKRP